MNITYKRRPGFLRLFLPAFLTILPMLMLGGGLTNSVQAGAPTGGASSGSQVQREEVLVLRVYFNSIEQRDMLAGELGAEEVATTDGYLTVLADRPMYNDLVTRGLRIEIDERQTKVINEPHFWGDSFYGGYKTVEEAQAYLAQMATTYPTLAQVVDYGDSWCKANPGACPQPAPFNGYDLMALHITNQAIPGPKPVYWFDAGIHSREIATPEMAMRLIAWLLDRYETDADSHWLVDYHDIWIVPMFNPDGHHIVEAGGGGNSPYYQRKNANRSNGCTTWPPTVSNQFGTDNNRNFPFMWNVCSGCSSGSPCAQTYRGPTAGSEPETQAAINKIRELIPDQRGPNVTDPAPLTTTGIHQSMHSNASLNLYPWGFTSTDAPNNADLRNIGFHMQARNAFPQGNGYQTGQPPEILYSVDGDTADWAYGDLGIPSYTTEVGGQDFLIPYTCMDNPCSDPEFTTESMWQQNRGALLYQTKIARTPYLLTRGPDADTVAVSPSPVPQGTNATVTGRANYAWTGNAYVQNVAAAEYYVDTPPWAGGTGVAMTAVDGSFNSPTEQVQGTIDTSGLSVGRHIVFIRGRGVNDYEGNQSWGPISAAWLDVTAGGTVTPATATATSTTVPPTVTFTVVPPTLTNTVVPPTVSNTVVPPTVSSTVVASSTSQASATSTTCPVQFSDVPSTDTFYANIRCLACRGIVSGYSDGTFRPNNPVTRGQLAKMVSNSAGFSETVSGQTFEDVPPSNTFYVWIERLAARGYMSGYPCIPGPGPDTCIPPGRPYFHPFANATRGQTAKIVANAAGFTEPPVGETFEDVKPTNTFYPFIQRLASRGVMGGYECGGPGEPCVPPENKPYFRPNNDVTRGQSSKIVANAFFPGCNPTARP